MTDRFDETLDETTYQIPESAVRVLQWERADVYIIPRMDEVIRKLVVVFPYESGARLAGTGVSLPSVAFSLRHEVGAYWTFSLRDLPQFRDEYERIRDQIRHGRTEQPREQAPNMDALQELIDILVVFERAIKFIETAKNPIRADKRHIETAENPEQSRHYQRMSALCDDPMTAIENVEQAIESDDHQSQPSKKLARVWPFANREEAENP